MEYQQVQTIVQGIQLNGSGKDKWSTIWKDGIYTSSKFYHYTFREQVASPIYSHIWKSKCLLRIKVFAWLLVSDRNCNVATLDTCVLYPTAVVEDWQHLFFYCNFSVRIWNYPQIYWTPGMTIEEIVHSAKPEWLGG
jgi:hypothetical protein